jgi:hypothetical protein
MDMEVAVRRAKGLAAFQSFSNVWTNKKLKLAHKMRVYHTYVVPCFLYGTEAGNWYNWTAAHVRGVGYGARPRACIYGVWGEALRLTYPSPSLTHRQFTGGSICF